MAMTITQVGEWVLADDAWECHFGWADARGQFQQQPVVTSRAGAGPVIGQGALTARTMPVQFVYTGTLAVAQAIQILAGKLGVDDTTPRRIIGLAFDGVRIQTTGAISMTSGWTDTQSMNLVMGSFVSGQARWEATTPTVLTASMTDVGQYAALPVPNAGYATVEPTLTIQPTVTTHLSTSATVGWQYRRQISFTNGGANAWDRPLRLSFGDTTVWVTDGALASGNDVRVLLAGVDQPRTLIAWNWAQTYCWINPPPIAPGETVVFDVVYGNPSAGAPNVLTGKLHPSFIYEYSPGTATSGTTTVLNDTTLAWDVTKTNFVGGWLMMVSGTAANLGLTREISAMTTNSVTAAAFPAAIAAGDKYLIYNSSNARWWFNVGTWFDDSSPTPVRGLWYLDKRTRQPSDIDFDVPGSWRPYAMKDNQDRFAQRSVSKVGGSYFAFLDAYRSWQGGGAKGQLTNEDGIADGVLFHSSIPILGLKTAFAFNNNLNGMCQAVVMAKASGAEDWETIYTTATAGNSAVSTYLTLPTPDQYFFLYRGLVPADAEDVIRPDRARDSGSTTADGATRNITTNATGATWDLRKDPDTASAHVQDATPADILVGNSKTVELDGRLSGAWRGVTYNDGTNDYKGWLPLSFLNTGSAVGGDTLVDGGKNWVTNELVGAQIRITGSPNANLVGKVHTVASNTATTITVTNAFGATVVQGTAYETRQPKTTVTLQDQSYCWVDFDTSSLTLGNPTAKQAVYQVAAELGVGDAGNALFERKVTTRVGLDGALVFLRTTDQLIISGPNRKATIVDSTGALISTLTDPAVLVQQVAQDPLNHRTVTKRSARWLPLGIGVNRYTNPGAETSFAEFAPVITGAGWTLTVAPDATTPMSGAKAWLANVTASGAINTFSVIAGESYAISPGQRVAVVSGLRTSNVNLQATLGVLWLNAAFAVVSATYGPAWTPTVNTWLRAGYSAINPDLANTAINWSDAAVVAATGSGAIAYAQPVVKITAIAAGATGSVRFDDIDTGSPVLWWDELGGNAVTLTVSCPAGYLG